MYDTIIIGGGPAGMSAALYAARYGLSVLLLERMYFGGQAVTASSIENYPGTGGAVTGSELMEDMAKQLAGLDVEIIRESVTHVELSGDSKTVRCGTKEYHGRTVIIAAGQLPRELSIKGEKELLGSGVSYCATCDGNFYRNQPVAIVGGGNTAVTEALFLSRICSEVHLIHRRDSFRAAKTEIDKLRSRDNILLHMNSIVTSIEYGNDLTGIVISEENIEKRLVVSGFFIAVGHQPNTAMFEGQLELSGGYIVTDEDMRTNVPGVFVAGDIRAKHLRQIVTAASDGAIAAYSALKYLE